MCRERLLHTMSDQKWSPMLEGVNYGVREVTMGSNRGQFDSQAMQWSRSLRGTHDNNVKKLRKEKEAKRRERLRKNGVKEEIAPRSASQEMPWEPPRRPRPRSTDSVPGAKKLLRILHLNHKLSEADEEVVELEKMSKKKAVKDPNRKTKARRRRSTSSTKPQSKEVDYVSCPVNKSAEISPLTSWRMDPSLPESSSELPRKLTRAKRVHHVTMSSQRVVKEPATEDSDQSDAPPHVTQWRYKPLPEEDELIRKSSSDGNRVKPDCKSHAVEMPHDFDLDDLRIVVMAMQKEHRQCIRSVAASLEHHTRQVVLLTKANSTLADHVESMEKEMKVLRAMHHHGCTTTP